MRVPIVIDELSGAQVAPELLLGKEIRDECVETFGWHILFLAVWAIALILEISDHAIVADQVIAFGALLRVFHHILAELADQEIDE